MLGCLKTLREQLMAEEFSGQTPIFGGSTGGLNEGRIKYVITWTSPKSSV